MKRSRGSYSKKGRSLKSKGVVPVTHILGHFDAGGRVRIDINPRFGGKLPLKFNHRMGKVTGMQGKSCLVLIKDGRKDKLFAVPAVHLKKA